MKRKLLPHTYDDIISLENILRAWGEFVRGKRNKNDVQEFQLRLMDNLCALHRDLKNEVYTHGAYYAFKINDPKARDIHKASVRDRLVHHAIYRILYPFFDRTFIADSYSCRVGKGTHKALNQFRTYGYTVSRNHTRTCWVLKCDIKKFFASIDHVKLNAILATRISDMRVRSLISNVVASFSTTKDTGLPLGNLTSQLLVNIFMNEFDQHMKHVLKTTYYIRYADDFVILSDERKVLVALIPQIQHFLITVLSLTLHPHKVSIATLASGVDFLGWVHFPTHRVLRTNTKRRMVRNCMGSDDDATVRSYRGLLRHGNAHALSQLIGRE